jgi:hypothetical protein
VRRTCARGLCGMDGGDLSGNITISVEPSQTARERDRCAKIAAIEAHYWGEVDDERIDLIAIGAMGAASNICCAILRGHTPAQHEKACTLRDSLDSTIADCETAVENVTGAKPFHTVPLDKL